MDSDAYSQPNLLDRKQNGGCQGMEMEAVQTKEFEGCR